MFLYDSTDNVTVERLYCRQVLPELGKYVKNGGVGAGQRQESSSQGAEGGLERTESEEKEYEYALSVEVMRKEKQENRALLHSLKKAKESDTGSLYENEISLLRHSIREKQELINRMHEKCISLAAKYVFWSVDDKFPASHASCYNSAGLMHWSSR